MGVLYYKYKSAKEFFPVQLPHSFISVSELKQLILTSKRHGIGRSRGRGPREDIALSNAQTGQEYADGNTMIPQNVTVLVRRTAGQVSENIVLFSWRKVIEDGSVPSVVTASVSKSCSSTEVKDEDTAITAVIDAAGLKWEEQSSERGQSAGRFTSGRHNGESVSEVDDLPAELHCPLCNKVMADAVLTSKCCFVSFCDKCIRDYIITQSKCVCGVKVLADSLIPNPTLRSTISNMLGTRTCNTASGTGKQRSSAGSNPDPKSQSHTTSAALETDTKQSSPASPDARLQVAPEGDQVDRPQKNSDLKSNAEGSAGRSAEKAVPSADLPKLKDVSESTLKNGTISGSLEPDQLKKKRKKADSSKTVHPNNADYGYNAPFDPAYCNPFNGGYAMGPFGVPEPYMYGSMGMPYGGYPIGPFGVDPFGNILPQALAMQGYPPNYQSWETQAAAHRDAEAHGNADGAARSRQTERPKDSGAWPRPSERNQRMGSPQGRELRDRPQSRPEPSERNQRLGSPRGRESRDRSRSRSKPSERSQRSGSPRGRESRDRSQSRPARSRDHGHSDRGSSDYHEDHHDRKRVRASSTVDGDTESTQRSRNSSRSLRHDDDSDDEQNFKRKWGRYFSHGVGKFPPPPPPPPRVGYTCAVRWPRREAAQHTSPAARHVFFPCSPAAPPTSHLLALTSLTDGADGDAAAEPHRAGDGRRAGPRRLLRGGAGLRARPVPHLLRHPGRLAAPPGLPRRRAPHHRARPGRRRRRLPGCLGRPAFAAPQAAPPGLLRGRLRRVPHRAQDPRHRAVREDPARWPHAPGLLLRPRRQWSRSYKFEPRR